MSGEQGSADWGRERATVPCRDSLKDAAWRAIQVAMGETEEDADSERRVATRHRVTFKVVCDDDNSFVHGTVLDVSTTGAFVHTTTFLPIDTELTLTPLEGAGEILFDLRAKVSRIEDDGSSGRPTGMGLHFLEVDEELRVELGRLCDEMPASEPSVSYAHLPIVVVPQGEAEPVSPRLRMRARILARGGGSSGGSGSAVG